MIDRYRDWPSTLIYEFLEEGRGLTKAQAKAIEAELELQPDRLDLRVKVLGNLMRFTTNNDKAVANKRARHILWIINNMPDHPVLAEPEVQIMSNDEHYAEAKTCLLAKLEQDPDNVQLVWNVALSILVEDNAMSEELLRHGEQLKPNDPGWPLMLSVIYGIRAEQNNKNRKSEWRACEKQAKKRCTKLRSDRDSLENDSTEWYL